MDELKARRLKLQNFNNAELIEGLGWALDQAMTGQITGACFIIKHDRFKHTIGILGKYREDPYCAMQATKKLRRTLKNQARTLEEHINIEHNY